jgi:hypothetical protein
MPRSLNSWRERRPTTILNDLAKPQSRAEPCCNVNAGHGQEAMNVCRTCVRMVRDTLTFLLALHVLRVRDGRDQGALSSDWFGDDSAGFLENSERRAVTLMESLAPSVGGCKCVREIGSQMCTPIDPQSTISPVQAVCLCW